MTPHQPARRWRLTATAARRLFAGGILVLGGLLASRSDVAVLGVPLVLAVVWGLARRPTGVTAAALGEPRYVRRRSQVEAVLVLEPAAGVSAIRLRVAAPGHRDHEVLVDARKRRALRLSLVTARTGRQDAFVVDHMDSGVEAVLRADPGTVGPGALVVLPQATPLGALPLPPRLQGLTGAHRSSRPGEGGDLRDIAPFAPGDRLRRIDWKTTARRAAAGARLGTGASSLYVRRTFATSEASVILVLDARDEVGPDVATWNAGEVHPHDATSLDIARRAAASLAQRYLDQGDRVGLIDPGRHRRSLRPAGGRRQLSRIVQQIALAEPRGEPSLRIRAPQIPSGALVVVFSTFLDDDAARLARMWRHAGHRTLAVDVLPSPTPDYLPSPARTALRIVRMEREDRLAALVAAGVEVVAWDDHGGRAGAQVALTALSRVRRMGR